LIPSSRENLGDGPDPETGRELEAPPPPPQRLDSAPKRPSAIPARHHRISPEADVLERSLHLKLTPREDSARRADAGQLLRWYHRDAFASVEEPDFRFEPMLTGENEDPVFCIDGDYYDASGRLLSVQQGKGRVIYVTEDGFDPAADFDDD
jgi:hypothetical protein